MHQQEIQRRRSFYFYSFFGIFTFTSHLARVANLADTYINNNDLSTLDIHIQITSKYYSSMHLNQDTTSKLSSSSNDTCLHFQSSIAILLLHGPGGYYIHFYYHSTNTHLNHWHIHKSSNSKFKLSSNNDIYTNSPPCPLARPLPNSLLTTKAKVFHSVSNQSHSSEGGVAQYCMLKREHLFIVLKGGRTD